MFIFIISVVIFISIFIFKFKCILHIYVYICILYSYLYTHADMLTSCSVSYTTERGMCTISQHALCLYFYLQTVSAILRRWLLQSK